jgi:inositol-polyphosphate multikinase
MSTVTSTGDHIPLASQVGGHKGVLASADGSKIIKPCLPSERKFYETVIGNQQAHEGFARLLPLVPNYFGILEGTEGEKDMYLFYLRHRHHRHHHFNSILSWTFPERNVHLISHCPVRAYGRKNTWDWHLSLSIHSIVLQNISFGYSQPNILDIKLGTVLYDDEASEDKKQRMIKSAKETTSLETGVRVTGFQVTSIPSSSSRSFTRRPLFSTHSIMFSSVPFLPKYGQMRTSQQHPFFTFPLQLGLPNQAITAHLSRQGSWGRQRQCKRQ